MALAMDVTSDVTGVCQYQKYGIQSISLISEASWCPQIGIRHLNGKQFFYGIPKSTFTGSNMNINESIEKILKEHIRKECILGQRKEKLEKLNEI